MSQAHDLPQSRRADEEEAEAALADLRRQLEAVKQRMEEHRSQMRAAGLTPQRTDGRADEDNRSTS